MKLPFGFQAKWGPLPDYHAIGLVDPIKIACILRSADAIQIDQRRAPDFLFALLNVKGVSREHWFAQNRLAQPMLDSGDPERVVFTSTSPFPLDATKAWWIAYDLVRIA